MRTPRLAGLAIATAATAAVTMAGCDSGTVSTAASAPAPSSSASAATAADPAAVAALAQSTSLLGSTSFKITATAGSGFRLTGAIDPPNGNGTAELTASGSGAAATIKTLLLGKDLYAQVSGITKPGTWMHVDIARLPQGANLGLRPGRVDPVDTAQLLGTSTDVQATGGNSYAGTLDLAKAAGLGGLTQVTIDGYGAAASKVPFTAGVDGQGRLTELTVSPPQSAQIDVLYSDYGAPVTVDRPTASEVTEAPANFYSSLGS